MRLDHLVNVAARCRHVRVGEFLAEFLDLLLAQRLGVARALELLAVQDIHRTLRTHDRELGARVRVVQIGADLLASHDAVCPAVRLARDHRHLWHRRLGERE